MKELSEQALESVSMAVRDVDIYAGEMAESGSDSESLLLEEVLSQLMRVQNVLARMHNRNHK